MRTKRQQQQTNFVFVHRLRPWVTAKALMLLVMLMVSVTGAWAEIKVGKITYYNNYGTAVIAEIDDDAVEIDIPAVVEYYGTKYDVTGFYQTFTLKNHANLKRVSILTDDNGECHITQLGNIFSGNTSIEVIELPNSITNLDWCTFSGCSALRRISLPTGITKIPDDMFRGCSSLLSIDIREGVTSIGQAAFYGCSSLENVILPSTLTTLGSYAFNGCSKLRSINIPDGITAIESSTFKDCSSLATVNLPEGLNRIDENAFRGTALTSLHIPSTLNQDHIQYVFSGASATLTSISVAKGNTVYDSRENCNAIIKKREYQWSKDELVLGCKNTIIPNNVNIIANAFMNCGLETLTFPKVVEVQEFAFYGCNNLKTFIFTGSNPNNYALPTRQFVSTPSHDVKFIVPHESLEAFRSKYPDYTIESNPSTIRTYYYSDLELFVSSAYDGTLTPLGEIVQADGAPARLGYSMSGRMSNAITDVRLVKAEDFYHLKEQLIFDGKTYHKAKRSGMDDGKNPASAYYNVYYTTDGCDVAGTPLLSKLEIDDNHENYGYTEPQTDKNYIRLFKIDDKGQVVERTDNADWNVRGTDPRHTYTYVKATYTPYRVPANEIHYTTTDDKKIEFSNNSVFGSDLTILSHEFEAGEGTIVFNDVVTGELAAGFAGNTKVSFIMLPEGINSIGNGAFQGCSALTGLMVSNKIHRIGDNAFAGCASYEKLPLGEWGVTEIGDGAFSGCTSFQSLSIPSAITSISDNLFKGCTSLQKLTFNNSLVSIGASAFENCTSLTEMEVPHDVALRTVGTRAFYNTGLETADLHEAAQLTEVGDYAFASCRNLMSLQIGRLERMPAHLFTGSEKAVALFISIFHGTMDDISFDDSEKDKLWRICLYQAPNMTSIPDRKFKDFTALHVFDFGGLKELTSIGREAFRNTNLDDADMTACGKLATIGEYAFADNPTLDKIELPVALTTINTGTFKNCTNIETVNIKGNVVNIGAEAFAGCSKLKTVMLNKGLQTIGSKAFAGSKSDLEVVANLAYEGTYASNTDCFDAAVYSGGTLRKVGENNANANIYNKEPWKRFKHQPSDGNFLMSYENCDFRIYEGNFPALDGRMLRGAELISTTVSNTTYQVEFPSEVNGYPVIAIASGAINMQYPHCHVTIPGSVVSLADNIFANDVSLEELTFKAGSEPLYVSNPILYKLNTLSVDRDIVCLNHGPFEGLKGTYKNGITLYIKSNCSKVADYFCKNSDVTRLSFGSETKFTFGNEAFRGCNINNIYVLASDGYEENPDNVPSNLFDSSVYRNAAFSISGPNANEAKFWNPWVNFYDPEVTQVTVNGATYKIYPRASYSYNIKEDFGVHNITGAVLTGGSFSGDVVIPEKVANFPVIAITKGIFNENNNVTSISFPGTLRMIENNAVEKMENLKKVTFRDQKFALGEKCYIGYAVYNVIDEEAFYKCDDIEEVVIGCTLDWYSDEDEPFEDRDNLKTVHISKGCQLFGKTDGDNRYLFNDCDKLETVWIDDADTEIEIKQFAFSTEGEDYSDLKYLYVGRNMKECHAPFKKLHELGDEDSDDSWIKFGDMVTRIADHQLMNCEFATVYWSPNITEIGTGACTFMKAWRSVGYCLKLEQIPDYADVPFSIWVDPEHPEVSSLKVLGKFGANTDYLYIPPSVEKISSYLLFSYGHPHIYLYADIDKIKVEEGVFDSYLSDNGIGEGDEYYGHKFACHLEDLVIHSLCSNKESKVKAAFPSITHTSVVKPYDTKTFSPQYRFDLHHSDSKKGDAQQSDGLYHEVCAGCGAEDRSPNTGNYYISNWNGSEDLMVHKKSGFLFYTYPERLTIDDSKPFKSPVEIHVDGGIDYNRTVTGGRVITFVVPFVAYASEVNGTVYKFREFKDNKFCFDKLNWVDGLSVNTPYLVVLNEDATQLFRGENTFHETVTPRLYPTVSNTLSPLACNVTGSDGMAQHVGSFVQQSIKDGDNGKSYYGYNSVDGVFVKAENATLNPFRTMFTLPQGTQAKLMTLQLDDDDATTDIIQVDADLLDGDGSPVYDLSGNIVTTPVRGRVYIKNGKKIINK